MSLMVTCPTCQATLRVPEGAETIRCPQCKTILKLQIEAPATEPVAPAKPAIPLPFARKPVAPPPEPEREAPEPLPLARGKLTRAKVIEEHEDEPDEPRRKKPKGYVSAEEAKEQEKLEKLTEELNPARLGIQLLSFAALSAIIVPITVTLFFLSTLYFAGESNILAWVPLVGLAIHWMLSFAGFMCCFFGPKDIRGIAIIGAIIVLVHFGTTIGLFALTAKFIDRSNIGFGGLNNEDGIISSIFFGNVPSNLVAFINLPILFSLGKGSIPGVVFAFAIFAGAIEFTKLSLIGMIANHYATEGKDPELGHQSLRFVYRIVWVVIFGLVGQGIILILAHMGFGFNFVSLPTLMIINAYHLWCIFAWVAEYQVLQEVTEVMTPERMISTQTRLGSYY